MSTPLKIKKAMSRDEVALLVDLVVKRPAITTKETNAVTNKLKEDAWNSLAVEFNKISDQARSKEQVKLKWDNLKKAARKRVSQLDREEAEMVPLGDILDRVSDLLGYKPDAPYSSDWIVVDSVGESYCNTVKKRKSENTTEESLIDKYKKKFESNTGKKESSGVKERNLAIARYYEKKAEKTELEIQLLRTQLNKQCDCSNNCKVDGNINNTNRSDIIDRIQKLSGKINSEKLNINNECSSNNSGGGVVVNNSAKTINNINNSDTGRSDSNSSNNDQFDSTDNVDSKENIVIVKIVKQETGSP